jgi:hypothetical protein
LRELLASKGFPNAKVTVKEEEVSATSTAVTFDVDQGNRSRIVDIEFEGNQVFKDGELRGSFSSFKETGLFRALREQDILDLRKLQYDLQKNVRSYMFSKGYFQARIGEPQVVGLGYKRTGIPIPAAAAADCFFERRHAENHRSRHGRKNFRVGELKSKAIRFFRTADFSRYVGLQKGEDRQRQTPAGRGLRRFEKSLRLAGIRALQRRIRAGI